MKYTVTITTPESTGIYTAWSYYPMLRMRFDAICLLHDKGYSVDTLAGTQQHLDATHPNGNTATITVQETAS